jgi:predicted dehydrogenase
MLQRDDIDFVIAATPWVWHAEMAISAMHHGKDVAVEVPAVRTLEDCWAIVQTSEQTGKHCTMLENCCYGYNETLILRMTHAGEFGDLLYGEGAYLHDLREELFSNAGEGLWRRTEHTLRDGNLYPTHGLGPVANYMGIQRGDRFAHLVSMSTPERGLDAYRKAHLKPDDPRMEEHYVTGDMNTSLIKTANGLTITVKHTVSTPHPYDRINLIAGAKGIFEDYPPRLYLDGQNKDESFGTIDAWKQYEHPLWKKEGEIAKKLGGHGGMDYIMLYRLLSCIRQGIPPDMDVYDAAAWSSVTPLSIASVAQGSAPQQFPDFTGGKWRDRQASAIATQT